MTERATASPIRQRSARGAHRALFAALAVLLLAASPVWIAPTAARAEIATQYQMETDLTCQCGCGLTVHSCNHLNCGSGIPLKKEIAEQIASGKSREDILSHFSQKYGEKILSSPTTTGFNIAAWTVPFVVIAIGGLIIGVVESLGGLFLGESLGQIGVYAIFIAILLFRPRGLFSARV